MGCSVVVVLCFACLVCLCLMVTPRYLSHLFSHMGELSIETKRIDDRQSFKRVRHRKKKNRTTPLSHTIQESFYTNSVFPPSAPLDFRMPMSLRLNTPPAVHYLTYRFYRPLTFSTPSSSLVYALLPLNEA